MAEPIQRKSLRFHARPVSYRILLEPDFEANVFHGQIIIGFTVNAPFPAGAPLQLHSKFLSVDKAILRSPHHSDPVSAAHVDYEEGDETIALSFDGLDALQAGDMFILDMDYTGTFNTTLVGFYQSKYTDADGIEHKLATTDLEPTYARQVFPCVDEPEVRASFVMSAVVDSSFRCFSNMPVESQEELPGSKTLWVFHKTPLMPTYLVSLLAGHLSAVYAKDTRFPLSVICPYGSESESEFALDVAKKGLGLFEDLFGRYPLPKLDLAAIPDFARNGMENWGLVMFRSTCLLLQQGEGRTSFETRRSVARVVLHELSHMWFGNLVTVKYWDGLWLKEGFANLMSWVAMDTFFPSWHTWDRYVANELQAAMDLDALRATRAVEQVVLDGAQAKQVFDEISYKKGCCILRMVSKDMSEGVFFRGVAGYLNKFAYGATESRDLWSSLQAVNTDAVSVADRMEVWTRVPGFPVVEVTEVHDDLTGPSLQLRQRRFLASGYDDAADDGDDVVYPLRIAVRSNSGVRVFEMNEKTLVLPTAGRTFVKINADHDSFFVTSYPSTQMEKLIQCALNDQLSLRDCIGMASDLKRLVSAGMSKTGDLLNLVERFKTLSSPLVWAVLSKALGSVRGVFKFSDSDLRQGLKTLTRQVFGAKADELGWVLSDSEDPAMTAFKASVFGTNGLSGDEKTIQAARDMFSKRVAGDLNAIHPSLRGKVFAIVSAHGEEQDIIALWELWLTSEAKDERYQALEWLGRAKSPDLVKWVLQHAFTENVRSQDMLVFLRHMKSTPHGAVELWQWTQANWNRLEETLPVSQLGKVFGLAVDGLTTEEQLKEVEEFLSHRDTSKIIMMVRRKVEDLKIRMRWAKRDGEDVSQWLKERGFM